MKQTPNYSGYLSNFVHQGLQYYLVNIAIVDNVKLLYISLDKQKAKRFESLAYCNACSRLAAKLNSKHYVIV